MAVESKRRVSGSCPCSSSRGCKRKHLVDARQQAFDAALFDEGRAEVGHQDVADEEHAVIGQVDQQGIAGFAAARRPQREARAADDHLGRLVDRDIGFVGQHVGEAKALAEEALQRRRIGARVERQFVGDSCRGR